MPVYSDFTMLKTTDLGISFSMSPPVSISGWSVEMKVAKRFGGSGMIVASMASGYAAGQSGITISDGALGTFTLPVNAPQTSGWCAGNYATTISRTDSGYNTVLDIGYLILSPR